KLPPLPPYRKESRLRRLRQLSDLTPLQIAPEASTSRNRTPPPLLPQFACGSVLRPLIKEILRLFCVFPQESSVQSVSLPAKNPSIRRVVIAPNNRTSHAILSLLLAALESPLSAAVRVHPSPIQFPPVSQRAKRAMPRQTHFAAVSQYRISVHAIAPPVFRVRQLLHAPLLDRMQSIHLQFPDLDRYQAHKAARPPRLLPARTSPSPRVAQAAP